MSSSLAWFRFHYCNLIMVKTQLWLIISSPQDKKMTRTTRASIGSISKGQVEDHLTHQPRPVSFTTRGARPAQRFQVTSLSKRYYVSPHIIPHTKLCIRFSCLLVAGKATCTSYFHNVAFDHFPGAAHNILPTHRRHFSQPATGNSSIASSATID